MKTKFLKLVLSMGMVAFMGVAVYAQSAITTSVGVTARLAKQLTVTKVSDVDFGGIFVPKGGDVVVTMDYQGAVSVTTGTTGLFATNLQRNGQLQIDAENESQFTVQYPTTVDLSSGAEKLVYTPSLYSKTGTLMPSSASTKYDVNQNETTGWGNFTKVLNVAGTLAIPTTASPGLYSGTVDVTVTWE